MAPKIALVEEAYRRAVELLQRNAWPEGFVASAATPHYAAVWARDAAISVMGAVLTGNDALLDASKTTLLTLARLQAPAGQIANAYWPRRSYWDWGEAGCTDAVPLFIIAAQHYHKATGDRALVEALWPSLRRAFAWLRCQDANNTGLVDSPEAGDWMDSTLNRCGKVFYVNVLYYRAAVALEDLARALGDDPLADPEAIRARLNLLFWPSRERDYAELLRGVEYPAGADGVPTKSQISWGVADVAFPHPVSVAAFREVSRPRRYYLSHVAYGSFADKCDVLANLLAILYDVADSRRRRAILGYLSAKQVASPYPVRCWPEPETPAVNRWGMLKASAERHQASQWQNAPYHYHNAGVWPFIGGFYVLALAKAGQRDAAERELERLARANRLGVGQDWGFHEWLDGLTGEPRGAAYQSWNAATYVMAYTAVREGSPAA